MTQAAVDAAAKRICASGRVVVLTGAGVSAESGIDTFRDIGGLWERFDPDEVATASGWLRFLISKPWEAIEFLSGLREVFARARPNPGHEALAELERLGHLRAVITQNVDGLHQEAGSERVIEIHGTFTRRRCMDCGLRETLSREAFVEDLDVMIAKLGSYLVSHPAHVLRRCACGGLFRADIVHFGEEVHDLPEAVKEVREAEVMIVCGTSGVVYPAAGLPGQAKDNGAFLVEVNPEPTELSAIADLNIQAGAGAALPALVRAVRERLATRT